MAEHPFGTLKMRMGATFFFVCHSAAGALSLPAQPRLHLWTAERLSDAVIRRWAIQLAD
jgi:hypothetical protein